MKAPLRVEAHGAEVCLFLPDDPFPLRLTGPRAVEVGEWLAAAGRKAIKNGERARRVTPATDDRETEPGRWDADA